MELQTEFYLDQNARWPSEGRHILAHFNEKSIIVYQAYSPEIGHVTAECGRFAGPFSYTRMSWIKPNFLWMMHRSGWSTKSGQEVTLAIELDRSFFDEILALAVPTSFDRLIYKTNHEWQAAVKTSAVRVQWDPDHNPLGTKVARRAIQLGLSRDILERYGKQEATSITDISEFVATQRANAVAGYAELKTPLERVYVPTLEQTQRRLQLDSPPTLST